MDKSAAADNERGLNLVRVPRPGRETSPGRGLRIAARRDRCIDAVFANKSGALEYRLYPPRGRSTADASLIVMLHGAGQDHLDFARGTRMHAHPDAADAFVVYPAQRADVPARCWNWFRDTDQARGGGEPAMLAALTRYLVAAHDISPRRIYVAGLSAGAAMAIVLGQAYPELYAAVGAHSGLPHGVASDMFAALNVMARGPSSRVSPRGRGAAVPTIVFHGDADKTVHPDNARAIVANATGCCVDHATTKPVSATRAGAGARLHTVTLFPDAKKRARVEQWIVHGGGHAWSGGSPDGSHTDPAGPDATAEMLRFFRSHRLEPRCAR